VDNSRKITAFASLKTKKGQREKTSAKKSRKRAGARRTAGPRGKHTVPPGRKNRVERGTQLLNPFRRFSKDVRQLENAGSRKKQGRVKEHHQKRVEKGYKATAPGGTKKSFSKRVKKNRSFLMKWGGHVCKRWVSGGKADHKGILGEFPWGKSRN